MTLDELAVCFPHAKKNKDGYTAQCPVHLGAVRMLAISHRNGQNSLFCKYGCEVKEILAAVGLPLDALSANGNSNGAKAQQAPPQPPQPPAAPPPQASQQPQQPQPPGKPIIDISVDELPILNAESWRVITQCNQPPILFCYGFGVVRTRYDYADDSLILDQMNPDIMRHELSQWADWVINKTNKKTGTVRSKPTKPPTYLVKDVLASRVIPLPRLNRIVNVPVFAPNGELQIAPGYHQASGVIYAPPRGYQSLDVPDTVTPVHVDEAKEIVDDLICDFPFACDNAGDSADRDNAIGLFLLPFVRDMIDGPTPLHLIDASMAGSGKGLLAMSLLSPGLGKIAGAPMPDEDTELKKLITYEILACRPVIYFDNVNHTIDSAALAAALTLETWNDRILGQSATANAKIHSLWVATGNNVNLTGEIIRRTIRIRLSPDTDRPEDRHGFKHEDQIEWVTENRPRLVWAAHCLIRNAIQQKLPRPNSRNVATFERWSRLIGSILQCAGYRNFLTNYRALQDGSDVERQHLSIFAMTWFEWAQKNNLDLVTTLQLVPLAQNIDGLPMRGSTEKALAMSLGRWLKSKHEVITEFVEDDPSSVVAVHKLKILNCGLGKGSLRGSQTWRCEKVDEVLR
jgi:hypothetical protein